MAKEGSSFCVQASVFVGVCVLATYTFLYMLQDKLLYQPGAPIRYIQENPKGYRSPEERRMNYAPVILQTSDQEYVHGWLMADNDPRNEQARSAMGSDRRLVVFFHENAGNLGLRLDYFQMLYHEANCDVLAIAYRGYSASSGKPTEQGLKLDAEAVMSFVDGDLAEHYVKRGGIFLIGRSLGGAVATAAISSLNEDQLQQIDGLVLENTFTSIPDMVDSMFSVIGYLKGLVLTNYWQTIDLVGDITLPILYVTGRKDEIVPTEQTHALYKASTASRHAQIWVSETGHHNDTWYSDKEAYLATLRTFMSKQHKEAHKLRFPPDDSQGKTVRRVVKYATVVEPATPKTSTGTHGTRQIDADL